MLLSVRIHLLNHTATLAATAAVLLFASAASLIGCSRPAFPMPGNAGSASERASELNEIRTEISQIPVPAKSRYLALKSLAAWENPYLTVQGKMVTLHVTVADANSSDLGVGGILRPVGARRQDLNVRTADLASAINAIPQSAWPYGRVVAVEEAHNIPTADRPVVRTNEEAAMKTLNDIGGVAYEWQENGQGLR
jgi:hypothetical protein